MGCLGDVFVVERQKPGRPVEVGILAMVPHVQLKFQVQYGTREVVNGFTLIFIICPEIFKTGC